MDSNVFLLADKNYLESCKKLIEQNKIFFSSFEMYYRVLNHYISNGGENYLSYVQALYNSEVLFYNGKSSGDREKELFKEYKMVLSNIITSAEYIGIVEQNKYNVK